jgi:hypothetical protein
MTYTTDQIREYIESHTDDDRHDPQVMTDMFESVYGREPDEDESSCLWSHVCNLVDHA